MLQTLFFVALASLASAQPSSERGYVVRVDSRTAWLDLTAADGAAPGRAFEVYTEGAELKHPVTGASLGRVQDVVAEGSIVDVSEKFSTGELLSAPGAVKPGQRARLKAAAPARPAAAARPGEPEGRAPKTQGAVLGYAVNAMAVGDFDGVGKPQVVLADENTIRLYAYPVADAKPLAETTIPGTGLRILGLEAADLEKSGRPALFVSVFDQAFGRFETRVFKLETGKWLKVAELPYLTRAIQGSKGERLLISQQISDDKSFPFGAFYPLVYQDGKYVQGRPALGYRRAGEELFGFTTADLGGAEPALLLLTSVHALRVQLGGASWRTPEDDYGQTPVRVRWQDRLLEFNPPMAASYGAKGFEALYAVRNMAALGGLATPFGLFNHGELVAKKWNGLALETLWKADLSGCAQGLAVVETAPGRKELAVAVRGSAGQSSVWTFEP